MGFENLFSPGRIGNLVLKNRVVLPPMATALCEPGGFVSDRLIDYHVARARGGCGLNIVEISAVHPSTAGNGRFGIGIYDDKFLLGLKNLAGAIRNAGGIPAIQLWHAGRQISSSDIFADHIVAPSAIACPVIGEVPEELTPQEIEEIILSFGSAAVRAKQSGFEAVEVHGAHGYLICQFLSAYSNLRYDRYGGTLENRARFASEIVKTIKSMTGKDFPLIFRLSSEEFVEGGLDIDQTKKISRILECSGADAIHVSAGNYETLHYVIPPMEVPAAFNGKRAAAVREAVNIPVIVAGRINDPAIAEKLVSDKDADFVAVGRGQLADPDFCLKAETGRADEILKCIACNQGCIDRLFYEKEHISCLLNPGCSREKEFDQKTKKIKRQKKILIAGAGPAGLKASVMLAAAGYAVILCESSKDLGGQFALAGKIPGAEKIDEAMLRMGKLAENAGVETRTGSDLDQGTLKEINPDITIVATGSVPVVPEALKDSVIPATEILREEKEAGKNVVVIGGGITGIETALFLANKHKNVTVLEITDNIAKGFSPLRKPFLLKALRDLGIKIFNNANYTKIDLSKNFIEFTAEGFKRSLENIDTIVYACGVKSDNKLVDALNKMGLKYYTTGDAKRASNALNAIWSASDLALHIVDIDQDPASMPYEFSEDNISKIADEIVRQVRSN